MAAARRVLLNVELYGEDWTWLVLDGGESSASLQFWYYGLGQLLREVIVISFIYYEKFNLLYKKRHIIVSKIHVIK